MAHGQFERGNKAAVGGDRRRAGRKPEQWKKIVNQALSAAVSPDDLEDAFVVMLSQARSGNVKAMALLLDRMVGKVAQPIEESGPAGGPIQHEHSVLSDSERADRIAALLDTARARRTGQIAQDAEAP